MVISSKATDVESESGYDDPHQAAKVSEGVASSRSVFLTFHSGVTAVFVKNFSWPVKKSSPSPLWEHRLPVKALALSARGLDNLCFLIIVYMLDPFQDTSTARNSFTHAACLMMINIM